MNSYAESFSELLVADATTKPQSEKTAQRSGFPSDPIEQMELAFVGSYDAATIKRLIDRTMRRYDIPLTDDNRNRMGSVLVVLRKLGSFEVELQ